jgi:hypothetical protein
MKMDSKGFSDERVSSVSSGLEELHREKLVYIFINSALRSENKFEKNTHLVLCLWLHLHNFYGQSAIAICLSIDVPRIRYNLANG